MSDIVTDQFAELPRAGFDVVCADPPWRFASNSAAKPGRNAMRHYPCMTDAEIAALDVAGLVRGAGLLFCWTTAPMIERSLTIVKDWGFRYKSQLIWQKERVGTGFWVRNRHEIILLCTKGKFPCPSPAPFVDSIIDGAQGRHSQKPEMLQDRIDEVWPDARKVELFARRARPGWSAFGNQIQQGCEP